MPDQKSKETTSFIVGMLVGLATGSALSMWLAPRSGKKTREEIQKIVVTLRSQAKDRAQSVVDLVQYRSDDESDDDTEASQPEDDSSIIIQSDYEPPTDAPA